VPSSAIAVDPHLDIDTYDPSADLMVLNLGPQHPSTHGVFRVKLYLDGEIIIKAVPYAGYLHRGVEKLCEQLTFMQIIPIVDKNDYAPSSPSCSGSPRICCGSARSAWTWEGRSAAVRRSSCTASASARPS
jgi:hypothetical protein